jgi:hypothetical protein
LGCLLSNFFKGEIKILGKISKRVVHNFKDQCGSNIVGRGVIATPAVTRNRDL